MTFNKRDMCWVAIVLIGYVVLAFLVFAGPHLQHSSGDHVAILDRLQQVEEHDHGLPDGFYKRFTGSMAGVTGEQVALSARLYQVDSQLGSLLALSVLQDNILEDIVPATEVLVKNVNELLKVQQVVIPALLQATQFPILRQEQNQPQSAETEAQAVAEGEGESDGTE